MFIYLRIYWGLYVCICFLCVCYFVMIYLRKIYFLRLNIVFLNNYLINGGSSHCVKSVKIRTGKNSILGHFSHTVRIRIIFLIKRFWCSLFIKSVRGIDPLYHSQAFFDQEFPFYYFFSVLTCAILSCYVVNHCKIRNNFSWIS